jgi:hypothetical protein
MLIEDLRDGGMDAMSLSLELELSVRESLSDWLLDISSHSESDRLSSSDMEDVRW